MAKAGVQLRASHPGFLAGLPAILCAMRKLRRWRCKESWRHTAAQRVCALAGTLIGAAFPGLRVWLGGSGMDGRQGKATWKGAVSRPRLLLSQHRPYGPGLWSPFELQGTVAAPPYVA